MDRQLRQSGVGIRRLFLQCRAQVHRPHEGDGFIGQTVKGDQEAKALNFARAPGPPLCAAFPMLMTR